MKRTPLRKKSKKSALKRKLWDVFSKYVKKRDNNICFTCGKIAYGNAMHAGHFIPKSVGGMALYFHPDNVRAQCAHCNLWLGGNQYVFGQKMGEATAKYLYSLKGKVVKVDEKWYLDQINYYQQLLKQYY